MYIRTISRKNKDGSVVRYIQLAHNYYDKESKQTRAKVLHNFGREENVDREGLARLTTSIARYLGPEETLKMQANVGDVAPLRFISSRSFGGAWVLNELWGQLRLDRLFGGLCKKRQFRTDVERAVFAMVANRALAPSSKLAIEDWATKDAYLPGVEDVQSQWLYRAMDFLLEARDEIEHQVFSQTANLLNLHVDLLYFDTTSTYFETEDVAPDDIRCRGHSKDHRPDLPQVVIGLAVTREGIPVRIWVWKGNTMDMSVIPQVKRDLAGWQLGRVITVVDRGFCSEENLVELQRAGGHYIAGERLRSGKPGVEAAISRAGRFQSVRDDLEVKEITVGNGEKRQRYILVRNPKEAERDRAKREEHLVRVQDALKKIGDLKEGTHTKACCQLISHPTLGRYVKTDKRGQPRIDRAKVKQEERLDGKYLLRTSDDTLSPEDIALGYKQLNEVEEAFRSLKTELDLRPVYHRLEDRITAHVILCWLALLLVRILSSRTGLTWAKIRKELETIHVGLFRSKNGEVMQRTELTREQERLFSLLEVPKPPLFLKVVSSKTQS